MFCLGLLTTTAAFAADIAVFSPEISNLSAPQAIAVADLVAQACAAVSQQNVLSSARSQPAFEQTHTYPAAAAQLGVREYLRLSAVAAGQRVVITAGRYRADGTSIAQAKQTAENIDDLTRVSDGIARALFVGSAPAAPSAALPLPAPATPPPAWTNRKVNDVTYGFKTGIHLPLARHASYFSALSLQFDARLQLPHAFLEFGAGFIVPTVIDSQSSSCTYDGSTGQEQCTTPDADRGGIGGFTFELGASRYLTNGNVAPYLGGGIIPRIVLAGLDHDDRRDIASVLGYAQFGLTFPRERSTRFFFDLRLAQNLIGQHLRNGKQVWPAEPSLHAGIGW